MLFMSHKLLSGLGLGVEVVCHLSDSRRVLCLGKRDWIFQARVCVHLLTALLLSPLALGWAGAGPSWALPGCGLYKVS